MWTKNVYTKVLIDTVCCVLWMLRFTAYTVMVRRWGRERTNSSNRETPLSRQNTFNDHPLTTNRACFQSDGFSTNVTDCCHGNRVQWPDWLTVIGILTAHRTRTPCVTSHLLQGWARTWFYYSSEPWIYCSYSFLRECWILSSNTDPFHRGHPEYFQMHINQCFSTLRSWSYVVLPRIQLGVTN